MKKISATLKIGFFVAGAFLIASCSNYSRHQDDANKNGPVDCTDLHMRNAVWHFESHNVHFDVQGTCVKGMRHGNFRFVADGKEVAVVKYSKDSEVKVKCLASGTAVRTSLQQCLSEITPAENASANSTGSFGGGSAWDQPID